MCSVQFFFKENIPVEVNTLLWGDNSRAKPTSCSCSRKAQKYRLKMVNPPNVTQEVIPRWKSWAHRTIVSWKPEYLEISLSPINEAPWVRQTNPDLKLTLHTTTMIIIITRSGMGLWGQDTVSRVHFWMFSTSRFAPLTLSSDLILLIKMWRTTDTTSHGTHMLKWG